MSSGWLLALSAVAVLILAVILRKWLRKSVKKWLASRVITTVWIPLIAALPPLIVSAAGEKHHPWPAIHWKQLREWLDLHPFFITAALLWPLGIIFGAYLLNLLRGRIVDELTAKEYGFVLHSLDDAAGKKMKRFGDAYTRVTANPPKLKPSEIFQTIAQPRDQRSALVDGIYQIFRLDAESHEPGSGDDITVKLARMRTKSFETFEAWLPADQAPNSGPTELCAKECSLTLAANTGEPVIIENINSELAKKRKPRFVPGAPGSSATGSLISFPVIHPPTGDVPYVVTVRSAKASHFKEHRKNRYAALLRPFLFRIRSEHTLSLLKEHHERSQ